MGKSNRDESQLNGLLDKGCSFEGKLMFDGTVQINGDFKGEIFSDGTLVVGSEAQINAKIQVNTLVIDGHVEGLIDVKKKLELRRGGHLYANIITPALSIEEGAVFQGQCQMVEDNPATVSSKAQEKKEVLYSEDGDDSLMM